MAQNPKNVPIGGSMTYAALEAARPKQLGMIGYLRRIAGGPHWEDDCRTILGDDWDGVYTTLSVAAASYLIHVLQTAIKATADADDDLQVPEFTA